MSNDQEELENDPESEKKAQVAMQLLELLERHSPQENTTERANFRLSVAELLLTIIIHEEVMSESYMNIINALIDRVPQSLSELDKLDNNDLDSSDVESN